MHDLLDRQVGGGEIPEGVADDDLEDDHVGNWSGVVDDRFERERSLPIDAGLDQIAGLREPSPAYRRTQAGQTARVASQG